MGTKYAALPQEDWYVSQKYNSTLYIITFVGYQSAEVDIKLASQLYSL